MTLRLWLGLLAHNFVEALAGDTHAQSVNIPELPVNQSEGMGIRHARGIAEAAKNIDRSHIHIHHITPVDNRQLVYGKTDIAGGLRIVEVPGSICSPSRRAHGVPKGTSTVLSEK